MDIFSISMIEKLFDVLYGPKTFYKLDIKFRYYQIRMVQEDISKIVFHTHEGHCKFLVISFGLTNAPSTFQGLMNKVFKDLKRGFVLVFFMIY